MCGELCWIFQTNFNPTAILDVIVVGTIFFALSLALRGTEAATLLRGVLILLILLGVLASLLPLVAFRWLVSNILTVAAVAIPIIFQPELRRMLDRLGRAALLFGQRGGQTERMKVIDHVCAASARLSERRQGALIVLERDTPLQEYINTGVTMESDVSAQLLLTIFYPKTELHDGAVILRNNKIASAACVLPLSSGRNLSDRKMGTRHRAALGISEVSDSVCVVVSEETGQISVANGGRMIRRLDAVRLKTILGAFTSERRLPRLPGSALLERLRQLLPSGTSARDENTLNEGAE